MADVAAETGGEVVKAQRPGTIKKGERRNPAGRKGKPKPPPDPPRPEGLVTRPEETQLEAMRWVLANEKTETGLQWEMRLWLRQNRKEFMAGKVTLERATGPTSSSVGVDRGESSTIQAGADSGKPAPPVPDVGSERAEVLIEKLLAEWETTNGRGAAGGD